MDFAWRGDIFALGPEFRIALLGLSEGLSLEDKAYCTFACSIGTFVILIFTVVECAKWISGVG